MHSIVFSLIFFNKKSIWYDVQERLKFLHENNFILNQIIKIILNLLTLLKQIVLKIIIINKIEHLTKEKEKEIIIIFVKLTHLNI